MNEGFSNLFENLSCINYLYPTYACPRRCDQDPILVCHSEDPGLKCQIYYMHIYKR